MLVVTERASYLMGARAAHPTLSSITGTLFHVHAAKAAAFFGWLVVAWYLVRR